MAKRKSRRSSSKKIVFKTSDGGNHGNMWGHDAKGMGWIFLILGILYLFTDFGWITWWNISWWTILFLIWGIKMSKH